MHRDSRDAAVGVAKLFVRASLPHFDEADAIQDCNHLTRLQYR
jgi:hypothetical protein